MAGNAYQVIQFEQVKGHHQAIAVDQYFSFHSDVPTIMPLGAISVSQ